ncbi:hypothetical protein DFQ30_009395, partial [Apophysomyces sp. BC1015]
SHEIRRCSTKEYYTYTGSPMRRKLLEARKKRDGIEAIESVFPTGKTSNLEAYHSHVQYFFQHMETLFEFYGYDSAVGRFHNFQGRQRAREEIVNILVNGGKKYNRSKRKKTRMNRKARRANRKKKQKKNECARELSPNICSAVKLAQETGSSALGARKVEGGINKQVSFSSLWRRYGWEVQEQVQRASGWCHRDIMEDDKAKGASGRIAGRED